MPKGVRQELGVQLVCSLCPKTPIFSDTSHLLTHISSKSHLSHRFKLQIRAQSELEAQQKLHDFDFWYTSNNLDALLAERLASKDKKKERKSRVSNASTSSVIPPLIRPLIPLTDWHRCRRPASPRRNKRRNSLSKKFSLPHPSSEPQYLKCTPGNPAVPAQHLLEDGSMATYTRHLP